MKRVTQRADEVVVFKDEIYVRFEPDEDSDEAAQAIAMAHDIDKVWDAKLKCYRFPISAASDVSKHFDHLRASKEFGALIHATTAQSEAVLSVLPETEFHTAMDFDQPVAGRPLYAHQKVGIATLVKVGSMELADGMILADDMGLGKTRQALIAAALIASKTKALIQVVAPAFLLQDWRDEIAALGIERVGVHSWAKVPPPFKGYKIVLIIDEGHYMGNPKAARTKKIMKLIPNSIATYVLTGTPMPNGRHIELFTLLQAIGHPLGLDQRRYSREFCKAHRVTMGRCTVDDDARVLEYRCPKCRKPQRFTFRFRNAKGYACDTKGCKHVEPQPRTFIDDAGCDQVERLQREIAPVMLRRLKTECLDLPPKTRVVRHVAASKEMELVYKSAVDEARFTYQERVRTGVIQSEGEHLAILMGIRQAASLAKVEAAIEIIQEALTEGSQVIAFTEFKASAKAIAKHFKVPAFTGDTPNGDGANERQGIKARFQSGEYKVFSGTIKAGGVGLTLTAGNVVLLVDRSMVPAHADQAEDRAYRIGQNWPVTAVWLRAFQVCSEIDELLHGKDSNIKALLGGKADEQTKPVKGAAQMVLRRLLA